MIKQYFSFKEVFNFGWVKAKQHAWFVFLTLLIISIIISATARSPFLSEVVTLMIFLSVFSISLAISRDNSFTFGDLYYPLLSKNRVLRYILLSLLYIIPISFVLNVIALGIMQQFKGFLVFGLILLPFAAYFAVRFMFYPFVAIEHENASVKELIKMTRSLTRGSALPLLGLLVLIAALNFGGVWILGGILKLLSIDMLFPAGALLFVTAPISLFTVTHVYNKLKDRHHA